MLGALKRAAQKVAGAGVRSVRRDLLQTIVCGSLLVKNTDGNVSDEEKASLDKLLRSLPQMQSFGNEITKTIDTYCNLLNAGRFSARVAMMKEIEDIAGNDEDVATAMGCIIDAAFDDGQLDAAEAKVLNEIATKLNVNLSDFGIAA